MGGSGSGGSRIGAGRKPKTPKVQAFTPKSIDGGRSDEVSRTAPFDLPDEQKEFWNTYAGMAIEARTLVPQTVAAFRLLCELDAEKQATKATIDKDGRTYIKCVVDGAGNEHQELKAHPLTSSYRQLAQRVEALMARFSLAPFGKPASSAKPAKAAANPWARIARPS